MFTRRKSMGGGIKSFPVSRLRQPFIFSIPSLELGIFVCNDPSIMGYKDLSDKVGHGNVVTFGEHGDIVINQVLGKGDFAVTFSGYYSVDPKVKFAFKLINGDIGQLSEFGEVIRTEKGDSLIQNVMREYQIMASLECLGRQGPHVCTEGACAFSMGGFLAFVIVLEQMESTLSTYLREYLPTLAGRPDEITFICLQLVLKTLNAFRRLHALQIYHMDGYSRNW